MSLNYSPPVSYPNPPSWSAAVVAAEVVAPAAAAAPAAVAVAGPSASGRTSACGPAAGSRATARLTPPAWCGRPGTPA